MLYKWFKYFLVKKLIIEIRDFSLFCLDSIFKLFFSINIKNNKNNKRGMLFVRTDAIGDFIIWLDAAKALRKHFGSKHIILICNSAYAELAKELPYFDEVIPINPKRLRKNLFYRYKIFSNLSKKFYETVIHFPYTRHGYFLSGETIVRFVNSTYKIGSKGEPTTNWRKKISNHFYNQLLPAKNAVMMELERNAEFLHNLGIKNYKLNIIELPFWGTDKSISYQYDYILFPGAGSKRRQWPLESYAKIAELIYKSYNWKGLICGGPDEEILGEQLLDLSKAPLINVVGKTTLVELIQLISRAKLLISNETSAIHIAAAMQIPAVCLLGGGHYGRFMPYPDSIKGKILPVPIIYYMECFGCKWHCKFTLENEAPYPCIKNISIKETWEKVSNIIKINYNNE